MAMWWRLVSKLSHPEPISDQEIQKTWQDNGGLIIQVVSRKSHWTSQPSLVFSSSGVGSNTCVMQLYVVFGVWSLLTYSTECLPQLCVANYRQTSCCQVQMWSQNTYTSSLFSSEPALNFQFAILKKKKKSKPIKKHILGEEGQVVSPRRAGLVCLKFSSGLLLGWTALLTEGLLGASKKLQKVHSDHSFYIQSTWIL